MTVKKKLWFVILCVLLFTAIGYIDTPNTVLALGTPSITSINPGSPSPVGTSVEICARVNWDSDFRSMRIRFGNEGWQEQSSPEFCRSFGTGHLSPDWYTIRVEVAGQGDNSWSSPTVAEASYQLTQAAPPPQPSCSVQSLNITPGSGTVGTQFSISGSGSCDTGVRAIRFKVDGGIIYELGAPSATTTWNSTGTWIGTHTATVEVAGWGDNDWSYAASHSAQFIVSAVDSPPPPPPDNPPPNTDGQTSGDQSTDTTNQPTTSSTSGTSPSSPLVYGNTSPTWEHSLRITATIGLNIRSGAGTNNAIIGRAVYNTYFEITGEPTNGWYPIRFDGKEGWVSGDFVEVLSTSESNQPPSESEVNLCTTSAWARNILNSEGYFITHTWILHINLSQNSYDQIERIEFQNRDIGEMVSRDVHYSDENYIELWMSSSWAWSQLFLFEEDVTAPWNWQVYYRC
jgi:hypothetical protein